MAIRLPSISFSKYTVFIAAQLVVNVSLAVWLYNEYLHNPYMQAYVSSTWSSIWPEVAVATGVAAGAIAGAVVYSRRRLLRFVRMDNSTQIGAAAAMKNLDPIDACPFCETPLKTISEGRLQCRNCRRYFKSSIPKIPASS
jgi:hypothetical protein